MAKAKKRKTTRPEKKRRGSAAADSMTTRKATPASKSPRASIAPRVPNANREGSLALVVVGLMWLAIPSASSATPVFSELIVFGDSLSDNGNYYAQTGQQFPASPPYYEGRLSNGPVWVEHLTTLAGLSPDVLSDFAVAGATSSDVRNAQVLPFVDRGVIPPDVLYVVWAGPNDFFSLPSNPQAAVTAAVRNIAVSVEALAAAGANDIMVANMPNLARMPAVSETGNPFLAAGALLVSNTFNSALATALSTIETNHQIDILQLDTFEFLEDLVANGGLFGLTNVTDRALRADGTVVANPESYLFWDEVHPTATGHALLADYAFTSIPEPSCLMLFIIAALAVPKMGCDRKRAAGTSY